MHSLDWLAIGGYVVLLLWLGFYRSAKKEESKDFILAGRKLSLPGFIATLVATWYGGILGIGENTYNYGIQTWFIFALPYYVFGLLFAIFLAPRIRHLPHRSIPDHFNYHFGHSAGIVSALLILFLASPAPYILSLGLLLKHTVGWPLQSAILISAGLSLVYIWYGGFRSVVRTDILQFGFMFAGFILLLAFAWGLSDAPNTLISTLPERYFDPTGGHSIQYIMVWFFIAMWTFIDPGFHQRTAAASSPGTAKKGILISIGFWFIFDILTVTTGLYAVALYPHQDAAMAYPELASRILPPFVYGIFLVGLFSTIMSTIDSNGLISAITFGRDILLRIQQKDERGNEREYIRKGLVVMAFIAVLLAISIPSIVRLWYVIGSIIVPGILLPFLMTFTKMKLNDRTIIPTLLLPVITAVSWFYYGKIIGHYPGNIEPFYPGMFISIVLIGIWKK
ncbi:MAG: sodium:solute symporter family protein [Candidatus Marinimicrobia bacterium]|nr:sodium:solute symporter family protein [Candidatus Neomarinimicrobiota bacterium]